MHTAEGQCGIRLRDGRCAGDRSPGFHGGRSVGLPRRNLEAADEGDPAPDPGREDFECERNGVANLFMAFAPLLGCRLLEITDRRTRTDWARLFRKLVDEVFPGTFLVLVMDNPNIHPLAWLYEAFPSAEARRIAEHLVIHFTPKHGSWLNLAKIELSVLGRQCLDRRIPDHEALTGEFGVWRDGRNRAGVGASRRCKTSDARTRRKSLYPLTQLKRGTSAGSAGGNRAPARASRECDEFGIAARSDRRSANQSVRALRRPATRGRCPPVRR